MVNAPLCYNLLMGRRSLNKLGVVVSTSHLTLKLSSPEGKVITNKVDQKIAQKCYENSLRSRRGMYTITTRMGCPMERHPEPARELREVEINDKKLKLNASLHEELEEKIKEIISKNVDAFAWSVVNMPNINPDFLCHHLTMDERVRPVV